MTKTKFNDIIRERWPELFWLDECQYDGTYSALGNVDTERFVVFIKYLDKEHAEDLMYGDDYAYENLLVDIIKYLEENEDLIQWLVL